MVALFIFLIVSIVSLESQTATANNWKNPSLNTIQNEFIDMFYIINASIETVARPMLLVLLILDLVLFGLGVAFGKDNSIGAIVQKFFAIVMLVMLYSYFPTLVNSVSGYFSAATAAPLDNYDIPGRAKGQQWTPDLLWRVAIGGKDSKGTEQTGVAFSLSKGAYNLAYRNYIKKVKARVQS